MFGNKPGEEQYQGKLNEFVVSRLVAPKEVWFVFHKRGEIAVSILSRDLEQLYDKLPLKERQDKVFKTVCSVNHTHTFVDEREFNRHASLEVLSFGKQTKTTLDKLVTDATGSAVLGNMHLEFSDA